MKVSYEWLQTFFDKNTLPSVEELEQILTFHAFEIEGVEEVGNTSVIDVDVLPNRASDSLSHRGIAHEISALLKLPMADDPLRKDVELTLLTDSITVSLDEDASCSYYVAAYITGISISESPQWLKERLEAIGQKSINNVVDATNYILFGLGQPTHVFDAKKLGKGIGTRLAKKDEKITFLGGTQITLDETMTVIVDTENDIPLAVAGVKGGVAAEVTSETTDIIIEAAKFSPVQTRKTAQALKTRTDASARFENDVPDQLVTYGAHEVVKLILDIAGGELVGYASGGASVEKNESVTVSANQVSRLLGADITDADIEDIFTRLEFMYTKEGDNFVVTAPFERKDIVIKEDVIEEIGRVYGYNRIESKQLDTLERSPSVNKTFAYAEMVRNVLAESGITETYLYSLRDSGEVTLLNALASDKNHLRQNLADGLVELLEKSEKNMLLLGLYDAVSVFEIGNVFTKDSEETNVAIAVRVTGKKEKEERTAARLTEVKESLEKVLGTKLPEPIGEVLEFSLTKIIEELPEVEKYPEMKVLGESISYAPFSQYPFMLRDVAAWVPNKTSIEEIKEVIVNHSGVLLKRCDLFDEFTKDGRTSYALHLVFQSMEETLTDEKVGDIMKRIEADINIKEGWEIR